MLKIKCAPSKYGDSNDDDGIKHPNCPHGPSLLFFENSEDEGYFACAAFRDKRDCSFHVPAKQLTAKHLQHAFQIDTTKYRKIQEKVSGGQFCYCQDCNEALLLEECKQHDANHNILKLSKAQINDPTTFLKPLDNDKAQAQYFFDHKALVFFGKCFKELGISKVICIGAPSLHAYLQNSYEELQIRSYLLDLDYRFYYFYNDSNFAWFNMCNNNFFDEKQELGFVKFLQNNDDERILLFTDPPFACRTEPISQTLRQLSALYNKVNSLQHQPLPIFWIFPYFSAVYIQNQLPSMEMSDYKVNYTNHIAYSDSGVKGNRKLGSPVRVFTNVPLELIKLPIDEGYKYCESCKYYTALENRHCKLCRKCPAKNGSTYHHCVLCGMCVKPNYIHCGNCRRCTQVEAHNCYEYQQKQRCWICNEIGHIERHCSALVKSSKRLNNGVETEIHCLLCGRAGHNERDCPTRYKYIEETTFLGKTLTTFKQ